MIAYRLPQNLKLIQNKAWSYQRTTGIEFNELFAVAALAYVESFRTYNPDKAAITTWATIYMNTWLNTFVKKEKLREASFTDLLNFIPEGANGHPTETLIPSREALISDRISFKEMICSKAELKTIYEMVVESPQEFIGCAPKIARGKIKRELRKLGWSWAKIWQTFREMKAVINETDKTKYNMETN